MDHYDGDAAAQERVRALEGTAGRDPGAILEEAINLWCYFLKLEGDPLAYRLDDEEGAFLRPTEQRASVESDPSYKAA